ncbi:hypothetical protein GY45DRAFT_1329075 [Cubamyces sp. BRFM 1775]|nr:hypothetical protein GY45DRAFT_1329075 [Cubamyces sp. BRFM 1775]
MNPGIDGCAAVIATLPAGASHSPPIGPRASRFILLVFYRPRIYHDGADTSLRTRPFAFVLSPDRSPTPLLPGAKE